MFCRTVKWAVVGFLALYAPNADSASSNWAETAQTKVRIIAGTEGVGNSRELRLGLQFQLQPGWKIYWRSPGDAGFPPTVKWDGSRNLAGAGIQWPAPVRFSVLGLETLGYKEEVVFPIAASAATTLEAVSVKAQVRYLTCNDICIPYEANLSMHLPAGDVGPSKHGHLIDRFRASVPGDGSAHGLKIDTLRSLKDGQGMRLQLVASAQTAFTQPDVFFEGAPGLTFGKPNVNMINGRSRALIDVSVDGLDGLNDDKGPTLDNRTFVVTLVDGKRAAELSLVARPRAPLATLTPDPPSRDDVSIFSILLLAIIGGLILNLMPCVLPVLSLKLLGLVQHGGGNTRAARAGFLASAAGIIASFLVLAGALASLKIGGMVVGWGIQFQQPWFLTSMAALITLFACNLWGFFEVRLPQTIFDFSVRAGNTNGLGGHFLQGSFAALLATPCSAPFLGTAVGFALAGGTADILLVFTALGLGMALPYLLIAVFPKTATWLPKPGPWMIKLKIVLGFALVAAGAWILTVLAGTTSATGAWIIAGLMAASGGVLYWAHKIVHAGVKLSAPALLATFLIATTTPNWLPQSTTSGGKIDNTIWEPFDEAAIPKLLAGGKTVYVDVTADWCITCLVNKGMVLGDQQVNDLLSSRKIIAMQADWTKPSDVISQYLAKHGRYGIPFNIVYGPKKPDGVVLPELLSARIVLDAFDTANDQILTTKNNR